MKKLGPGGAKSLRQSAFGPLTPKQIHTSELPEDGAPRNDGLNTQIDKVLKALEELVRMLVGMKKPDSLKPPPEKTLPPTDLAPPSEKKMEPPKDGPPPSSSKQQLGPAGDKHRLGAADHSSQILQIMQVLLQLIAQIIQNDHGRDTAPGAKDEAPPLILPTAGQEGV